MTKHVANVLLIDDDKEMREALSDLLEHHGYRVQAAADGAAGLALLRGGYRPCVILLDLVMRGMDGWDFRAAQRRERALASIPVVVMSGVGFSVPTIKMQFGDVEVVSKPAILEELVGAIQEACKKHK